MALKKDSLFRGGAELMARENGRKMHLCIAVVSNWQSAGNVQFEYVFVANIVSVQMLLM